MAFLLPFCVFMFLFLGVHGYVMSDGRWWVAIAQPVLVTVLVVLMYWGLGSAGCK